LTDRSTGIRALIFDFDGLILDTESPDYQSWQETYQAYGSSISFSEWARWIGTMGAFDPYAYLEEQVGHAVDRAAIRAQVRARFAELVAGQPILPGVRETIHQAKRLGLKLGIASSSSRDHILSHLGPLGLEPYFDSVSSSDDVEHTKPDPAVYLAALSALGVKAHQAIALEDSPNGVLAAKRAGLYCVAVPNALTRQLSLDRADLQLASLADLPLEKLLAMGTGHRATSIVDDGCRPEAPGTQGRKESR
jgi:HAD superfamily hydrolase (TIGR01509 family)